mmetsp:Transcript_62516/g.183265  ORF Transcript_62516/g.183265 Transcript_62516/m.183265 type:complete len:796 (+) Transcript_62516:108-2495(+)
MARRRHGRWAGEAGKDPQSGKDPRSFEAASGAPVGTEDAAAPASPRKEAQSQRSPQGSPGNAAKESREASWEQRLGLDKSRSQLKVSMSGLGMSDKDVERWCHWFESFAAQKLSGRGEPLVAKEVNFAENHLTHNGVRSLLRTLLRSKVAILVLKLFHNKVENGDGIAEYILGCDGSLQELHVSHNELSTAGAHAILLAVANAKSQSGDYTYPRRSGGRGASPLWLRMEQNYVDQALLTERFERSFAQLKRTGKAMCDVTNRACTPHCCARHRRDVPTVHVKHLGNQRRRGERAVDSRPQPSAWDGGRDSAAHSPYSAEELAGARKPGQVFNDREAPSPVPPGMQPLNTAAQMLSGKMEAQPETRKSRAEAKRERRAKAAERDEHFDEHTGATLAKVLLWDAEAGMWVPDTIEIPPEKVEIVNGVAHSQFHCRTADELKLLLGIGSKSAMDWSPQGGRGALDSLHTQVSSEAIFNSTPLGMVTQEAIFHSAVSSEALFGSVPRVPIGPVPLPISESVESMLLSDQPAGALPVGRVLAKRSKRGLQPSGSGVNQALGSILNPHAREFQFAPTQLNPQAKEFLHESFVPQSMMMQGDSPAVPLVSSSALNPHAAEFMPTSLQQYPRVAANSDPTSESEVVHESGEGFLLEPEDEGLCTAQSEESSETQPLADGELAPTAARPDGSPATRNPDEASTDYMECSSNQTDSDVVKVATSDTEPGELKEEAQASPPPGSSWLRRLMCRLSAVSRRFHGGDVSQSDETDLSSCRGACATLALGLVTFTIGRVVAAARRRYSR